MKQPGKIVSNDAGIGRIQSGSSQGFLLAQHSLSFLLPFPFLTRRQLETRVHNVIMKCFQISHLFMYISLTGRTGGCLWPFIHTQHLALAAWHKLLCMQENREFLPNLWLSKSLQMDNPNAVDAGLESIGHFVDALLETCFYLSFSQALGKDLYCITSIVMKLFVE